MDYKIEDQPWLVDEPFSVQIDEMPRFIRWLIVHVGPKEVLDLCNAVGANGKELEIELRINGVLIDFPRFAQRIEQAVDAQVSDVLHSHDNALVRTNNVVMALWKVQQATQEALAALDY